MGSSLPWTSLLLSSTNLPASKLIPTIPPIPPNDCAIINSELLLINHNDRHPANDSSFFRPLFDCGVNQINGGSVNSPNQSLLCSPFSLGSISCLMTLLLDYSPSLLTTPLAFAVDIHSFVVSSSYLSYHMPAHYFSVALVVG